jgi:drug/metabolite transporter (DMT)-like permease
MTGQSWRDRPQVRALLWVLPCVAVWALIPLLASNTGELDSFSYLFWSSAVSAACLLLCTKLTGHWATLRAYSTTDLRRLAALAALGAFAYYALLYAAYAPCGGAGCPKKAAIVVVTQYTWPAFTVLWSAVLLREKLTRRTVVSLLLGVVAVGVAVGADGFRGESAAVSKLPPVVLAAVIFGLYSTLLKRVSYEPFSSMAVGFTVATILSLLAAAQFSRSFSLGGPAIWSVLINGLFVNGVSYVWWYRALQTAPVSFVAPWVALTPLLAAALAGNSIQFESRHWIGIALILVSVLFATITPAGAARRRRRHSPRPYDLAEESS